MSSNTTERAPSNATTSAVFVTFNSASTIGGGLAAAREAYERGDLECIVVDNASSDDTVARVGREHQWVTLIENGENVGYGRACNIGLRAAVGSYFLIMNADAVLPAADLDMLVRFLDEHPDAAMVAPAIIESDGSRQDAGAPPTPWTFVANVLGFGGSGSSRRTIEPGDPPRRADWLCGAVLLVRRSVFEALGGFDPRFFLYFDETDLCKRILERGGQLWAVGEARANHVSGASARTTGEEFRVDGADIKEHYFRSRFYYLAKHHGYVRAVAADVAEVVILGLRALPKWLIGRSNGEFSARLRAPILRSPDDPGAVPR